MELTDLEIGLEFKVMGGCKHCIGRVTAVTSDMSMMYYVYVPLSCGKHNQMWIDKYKHLEPFTVNLNYALTIMIPEDGFLLWVNNCRREIAHREADIGLLKDEQ